MPQADFVIRQGDTASPLFDTLKDADGNAVDIQGADVLLNLVPVAGGPAVVSGGTATIDQVGDGSNGTKGEVSYTWHAGQTDVDGFCLGSWKVTFSDNSVQTFPNDGYILVQVSPTAPTSLGRSYVSLEELKAVKELTGFSFDDIKINRARLAASRAIDQATGRRFWLDDDNTSTRVYTPTSWQILMIDDVVDLQAVDIDRVGNGSYSEHWTEGTDYVARPLNAAADGKPFEEIQVRLHGRRWFPKGWESSVRVTGQFGWAAIPDEVVEATKLITVKLMRRSETPFAIVVAGADSNAAIRIARTDPDVANLLDGLDRRVPFV